MKMNLWAVLVTLCAITTISSAGPVDAATGTLKYTFEYKDPTTGIVKMLPYGFVYLHDASKSPPLEKYFSKADYLNCSSFGNGTYSDPNVPAGTWFIRITQRQNWGSTGPNQPAATQYGPPQQGDYTWMQTTPITIVAGQTLNLGTLNATLFGSYPITITGTVTSAGGVPLAGRYVRAQTVPCEDDGYDYDINQCGPVKDLALQPTDANGNYTLVLRNPGTYYLYTSPCISASYRQYTGNVCAYTAAPGPVTVKLGDTLTVNLLAY